MKRMRACLAVGALLLSSPVMAQNSLVILSSTSALNVADVAMTGSENRLTILQEAPLNAAAANSLRVSLNGDRNGGPEGAIFSGAALSTGLMPGSLVQQGQNNAMDLQVSGSGNLFAMLQRGNNNAIVGLITGSNNQAAVQQFGGNNFASFSQTGTGNNVSITQRSR